MPTPTPNPLEEFRSKVNSIQADMDELQKKVRLTDQHDAYEDMETKTAGLAQRVQDLRKGGYVFEKSMESKAIDLQKRWQTVRGQVQLQINQQSASLQAALPPVETSVTQLSANINNLLYLKGRYPQVSAQVKSLESRASAAANTISGMYDSISNEMAAYSRHLDEIAEMQKKLASASFQLLPTESAIMAVKAVYVKDGSEDKSDPDGILYLTDQRLIFEHREEVATKKVLFITTERKTVQKLLFEVPVETIDEVTPSKQGMFKNEDNLDLKLGKGAFTNSLRLHIWQDGKTWAGLIRRVKEGEFDKDRAVAISPEVLEKLKKAPTQCPKCGGALNKPILRGQDSIVCDFCGAKIRL